MKQLLALFKILVAIVLFGIGLTMVGAGGSCVGQDPEFGITLMVFGGIAIGAGILIVRSMLR